MLTTELNQQTLVLTVSNITPAVVAACANPGHPTLSAYCSYAAEAGSSAENLTITLTPGYLTSGAAMSTFTIGVFLPRLVLLSCCITAGRL